MLRLQVRGDAFLARIFDNDDAFKRLDFPLSDMASSAAWVKVRHDLSSHFGLTKSDNFGVVACCWRQEMWRPDMAAECYSLLLQAEVSCLCRKQNGRMTRSKGVHLRPLSRRCKVIRIGNSSKQSLPFLLLSKPSRLAMQLLQSRTSSRCEVS